ncbi:MAG: hypothetical protein WB698_07965 [Solirubrobacteraceae bacterium]
MRPTHSEPQRAGKALERRASELAAQQDDDEHPERVSAADLDKLRGDLHAMLNDSDPKRVKAVLPKP